MKKRRDKIREISGKIETCKFQGTGKKNVSGYLLQLENNINPYGKFDPADYEHDGHIWEVIGKIAQAGNEEEFKKYQKELLSYLQLLLKEDWERSKKEVKGYSQIKIGIILCMIQAILVATIYFGMLGLKDISTYVLILASPMPVWILLFDYIASIPSEKEKKKRRRIIEEVVCVVGFFIIFHIIFPETVVQNVVCYEEESTEKVSVDMSPDYFWQIEKSIEGSIEKEVELFDKNENTTGKKECTVEERKKICAQIKEALEVPAVWMEIIMLVCCGLEIVIISVSMENKEKRKEVIEKIKNSFM